MTGTNVIVGLGKSGYSCAQYFKRHGIPFSVMDADPAPERLAALRALAPEAVFTRLDEQALLAADRIVLSPGVPRSSREIQRAIEAGVEVTGDIALFGELAEAPIVAITGSNGKSTVTSMVGEMARAVGLKAGVGGNIGVPCLDLLEQDFELYVIEVSSYQLETATRLPCEVAVVLNLSPDHMDRYSDVESYYRTKAGIYGTARFAVVNRDAQFSFDVGHAERVVYFGGGAPRDATEFGLRGEPGAEALCLGDTDLVSVNELPVRGGHNYQNALAALAIGSALDWDMSVMLAALKAFKGLPHRTEWVASKHGVDYINDSKATNIGSTIAAVEGLGTARRNIVLILGGIGKGADFSVLANSIERHVKQLYVYGRDRDIIARQLAAAAPHVFEKLADVVNDVERNVVDGDIVLLSPACASQDQFRNFEHRGDVFRSLVTGGMS